CAIHSHSLPYQALLQLCYSLPPPLALFFFSSRRRHTRSKRDWSSDVCSSDLEVISVRFRGGCKNYYFDPCGHQVKMGDQVIVETAQGPEFATCTEGNHEVEDSAIVKTLSPM